jgi:hypothetical protein
VFAKINVTAIIRDHYATLVESGGQAGESPRASAADYGLFLGLPVIGTGLLIFFCVRLSDTAVIAMITALSIFGGLLFNLLVLIAGLADRKEPATGAADPRPLLREVYANIAYALLVSLVTLIPLCVYAIVSGPTARLVATALAYALIGHFLLTLLMILKRMHALLTDALRRPRPG